MSTSTQQPTSATASAAATTIQPWFDQQGWEIFDFQQQVWHAWGQGSSGLVFSPTGSGKTLAAWLGPVVDAVSGNSAGNSAQTDSASIKVLWITPLRALATDTARQLSDAATALGCDWRIESRTGDSTASQRQRQRQSPPDTLVTTPESLSVLLSYKRHERLFRDLHTVVVDEWHELMSSKRGVQLELCLARLRSYRPVLRTWGLSATIANLDHALEALLGPGHDGVLIEGRQQREIQVETLLPASLNSFPWAGHLGIRLAERAIEVIEASASTLMFTNTRSQAEIWFETLTTQRPDWLGSMALHHGSIDRKLRLQIEEHLRAGRLRCVVCTSSLDLGVDFSPVESVIQVGSPKGIARMVQRAGRSGHQPGKTSRLYCLPANAFELVEFVGARRAIEQGDIEPRHALQRSIDVLVQHLVTVAMGSGFSYQDMLTEVRSTHAFSALTELEWQWALDFIVRGGQALKGYAQYSRVVENDGMYRVLPGRVARQHRMSIGTIGGDTTMQVRWMSGGRIGHIEESFISRLKKGQTFLFSGRLVELVQVRDMTAYVRKSTKKRGQVPRWQGGRFPLSNKLANAVLETLELWQQQALDTPELQAIDELLQLQVAWSQLPRRSQLLVEQVKLREGHSLFFYPFAGRLVNEGLAMLVAWRLGQQRSITFTLSANDYGFELLSRDPVVLSEAELRAVLATDNLLEDLLTSLNTSEAAQRQFRDIARIAGLVFQGYPGSGKSTRQIQASSSLIYQVLSDYDADNLLLDQANREVLEAQMEYQRMHDCLSSLQQRDIVLLPVERLTPLSFPLWADRLQSQTMSSENWRTRVEKMLSRLEKAAADTLPEAT